MAWEYEAFREGLRHMLILVYTIKCNEEHQNQNSAWNFVFTAELSQNSVSYQHFVPTYISILFTYFWISVKYANTPKGVVAYTFVYQ
jgi:hypothetical protein